VSQKYEEKVKKKKIMKRSSRRKGHPIVWNERKKLSDNKYYAFKSRKFSIIMTRQNEEIKKTIIVRNLTFLESVKMGLGSYTLNKSFEMSYWVFFIS
jgi:hypothetical protein